MCNTQESEGTTISDLIPIEPTEMDGQRIAGVRWKRKAGGALEVTYTPPGDVGPVSSLSTVLFDALEQSEFWRWLAHVRE